MKTKSAGPRLSTILGSLFALALILATAQTASAQWTNGTNINNTNSGNVGIGTTNPAANLQVESSSSTTFRIVSTGDHVAYLRVQGSISSSIGDWYAGLFGTADYSIGDITNSAATYLTIKRTSGNVGIGTASPAALFHAEKAGSAGTGKVEVARFTVNDSGASRGILIYGTTTGGTPVVGFGKNTAVDYGFFAADGTTRLVTIQDGGNVGIGTASPATKLEVSGIQRISQARGSDSLQFYDTTGGVVRYTIREVTAGDLRFYNNTTSADAVTLDVSGNVGIATGGTSLSEKLEVNGNIKATGTIYAKYQDVAEWVPSSEQLSAGTVVVLDTTKSNQVISSSQSYDTRVAGVISVQPGIALGEKGEGKVLVATTGRVKIKVNASKSPIHIGDLLVTSDIPGVAMKSEAVNLGGVQLHRPGTLIGKALEPLAKGKGEILVLLSLQ